ncbi:MAG: hypothetical protein ACKJRS_02135 [Woeseiaceae bacterium]
MNATTKIDWDCEATKKHIKEAEAVGPLKNNDEKISTLQTI